MANRDCWKFIPSFIPFNVWHTPSLKLNGWAEMYREIESEGLLGPRFNVAPTQTVPVVPDESPGKLSAAKWGLIPARAKDRKIGSSLINARAETVAVKPAFQTAFKKRRCLIPADGFYEWQKAGAVKIPHRITVGDGLFFFAGLWEVWNEPGAGPGEILHDHHDDAQCGHGAHSRQNAGDSAAGRT